MKKYFKLYLLRLKLSFKILSNSKSNFIIGILGFLTIQISSIIFINITFSKIPQIEGYNFFEIIALYGFSQIPKGLDHFYSDFLWNISTSTLIRGEYDKFMLRPVNTYFQVLIEKVQFDALGEIILGSILYVYGLKGLNISFDFKILILSIFFIIIGSIIFTCLKTIAAASAFKFKDSFFLLKSIYSLNDFSRYPLNIYPQFLKALLSYIFAFSIASYYPMEIILKGKNDFNVYAILLIIPIILISISIISWKKGEEIYESAGA